MADDNGPENPGRRSFMWDLGVGTAGGILLGEGAGSLGIKAAEAVGAADLSQREEYITEGLSSLTGAFCGGLVATGIHREDQERAKTEEARKAEEAAKKEAEEAKKEAEEAKKEAEEARNLANQNSAPKISEP